MREINITLQVSSTGSTTTWLMLYTSFHCKYVKSYLPNQLFEDVWIQLEEVHVVNLKCDTYDKYIYWKRFTYTLRDRSTCSSVQTNPSALHIWIFHHIFPYNCRRFLSQVAFPHPWLEHDAPPVLGSPSDSFDWPDKWVWSGCARLDLF